MNSAKQQKICWTICSVNIHRSHINCWQNTLQLTFILPLLYFFADCEPNNRWMTLNTQIIPHVTCARFLSNRHFVRQRPEPSAATLNSHPHPQLHPPDLFKRFRTSTRRRNIYKNLSRTLSSFRIICAI